jgi:hypothetical protein
MNVLLAGFIGQLLTKLSDLFLVIASEAKQSDAKHCDPPWRIRLLRRFTPRNDFCARKIIAHYF